MPINFNKAASSQIKPQSVIETINSFVASNSFHNAGRGGGELKSMEGILGARYSIAKLLSGSNCKISPNEVIFTSGATESLNMLIGGLSGLGSPNIVISCFEHNSVARPAYALAESCDASIKVLELVDERSGKIFSTDRAAEALKQVLDSAPVGKTSVFICTNASNVFGNILPVDELFKEAKRKGAYTILDTAQTLGHIDTKMTDCTDALVFTGHKGLGGLPGTGGFVIKPEFADVLSPWKSGGTGSTSHLLTMPDFLPDKFECGTPNTLGIAALDAAAKYVAQNLDFICRREEELKKRLISELLSLPVQLYGEFEGSHNFADDRVPVISLTVNGYDSALLADDLEQGYGILTRTGLHCAPLAHTAMGTMPEGTLRVSINSDNTEQEIEIFINALKSLIL